MHNRRTVHTNINTQAALEILVEKGIAASNNMPWEVQIHSDMAGLSSIETSLRKINYFVFDKQ